MSSSKCIAKLNCEVSRARRYPTLNPKAGPENCSHGLSELSEKKEEGIEPTILQ